MSAPSALGRLARVAPRARRALVVAVGLGVVEIAAALAQAVALGAAIAALATGEPVHRSWLVALVVASGARALARGAAAPAGTALARPVRTDLRAAALAQVVRQGRPADPDATTQLLTRGVDEVEAYLARVVPARALAAVVPPLVIGFLLVQDWISGLTVALTVVLLPIFLSLLGRAAHDAMAERWRDQQRLATAFGDIVRGMTALKSLNRSARAVERLDAIGERLAGSTMATLRVAFASSFALELLSSLATALVALELGLRLVGGTVSLRTALVVLIATPEAYAPLRRAAASYHASATGVAAVTDVVDLIERARPEGTAPAPAVPPRLELVGLVARAGVPALSAEVPAGALVVLAGPSGIGKSSVLAVLGGLSDPTAGQVLVDGADLADLARDAWQSAVGWVAQEPVLVGETLLDAVRQGRDLSPATVRAALATVGVDLALDHPLGEGATLSAGQRRRVALAACLVADPVVLLLDEPTAHQDAASEAAVWAALDRSRATRVVVSHRPRPGDAVITVRP